MRSVRPLALTSPSESRDCRNSIAARGSACAECFAVRYPWFVSGSAARPCDWPPPNRLGGRTPAPARHVHKEALRWTSTLHPLQLQQRVLSRQRRPCRTRPAELRTVSMAGRDAHTEVAGKFSEPSDIVPSFVRGAAPASGRVRRAAGFPRTPCEVSSSPRGAAGQTGASWFLARTSSRRSLLRAPATSVNRIGLAGSRAGEGGVGPPPSTNTGALEAVDHFHSRTPAARTPRWKWPPSPGRSSAGCLASATALNHRKWPARTAGETADHVTVLTCAGLSE
nr:unnamed protein product [Leishmania braziliensis]